MQLQDRLNNLFLKDEKIQGWIAGGVFPAELAEICSEALGKGNEIQGRLGDLNLKVSDELSYLSRFLTNEFFPSAPPLERGGFMKAMQGGPAPNWLVMMAISSQIKSAASAKGFVIE